MKNQKRKNQCGYKDKYSISILKIVNKETKWKFHSPYGAFKNTGRLILSRICYKLNC